MSILMSSERRAGVDCDAAADVFLFLHQGLFCVNHSTSVKNRRCGKVGNNDYVMVRGKEGKGGEKERNNYLIVYQP